ncbi:DUF4054 domain-containing protein [Sphingomonas sp.]|uniref:DUF4054 domain-containing protein n=1 Tax=Sphingomonas sp. TaxID=28214 RepID=UPI003B3A2D63
MPYEAPTPVDLKARYPAFAAVSDATIQIYLDQANGGDADQSWSERDFSPAVQAAAAHRMARAGVLGTSGTVDASAGITSFKSASVSIEFSADAVKAAVKGGWASTPYGQDYADLLARNKGGARVLGGGGIDCNPGFNGFAGPLPPWHI